MTGFKVGDVVWVDEGDGVGCYEYGGTVEAIDPDTGELIVRVETHPILVGVPTGELRATDPDCAEVDDRWKR